MRRVLILHALARAIDGAGDLESATAALGGVDPLLRGRARRELRAAFADASLASRVRGPGSELHALRLTYLHVAGAILEPGVIDDVARAALAFESARAQEPPRAPRSFWWATFALAAASLLAVAMVFTSLAGRSAPPPRRVEPEGPAPRGAFAVGGVPEKSASDARVHRLFATDLPAAVIALDRWSSARRDGVAPAEVSKLDAELQAAIDEALDAEARAALGPGPSARLADLFRSARTAAEVDGPALEHAGDAFMAAAGALDDDLASASLGYFVDSDLVRSAGRRSVIVYSFAVERVSIFRSGAVTARALHIRRLDALNWSHTLLGFTRPGLRFALVLLDQLEGQVVSLLGPAMAPGAGMPLFEPAGETKAAPVAEETRRAVEARAGELARAEYGSASGVDTGRAADLGALLGRRKAMFDDLEARLARRGLDVAPPKKLLLGADYPRELGRVLSPAELSELHDLEGRLADPGLGEAFAGLRAALSASVERHEVQHRLDALAPRAMPKELEARVGPREEGGKERRQAASAAAELSAYLAEIARDPVAARVGLSMVARFLFDARLHGAAECYAALTIVEGLARELGVTHPPLLAGRSIDRAAVGSAYLALTQRPADDVRAAARRLWQSLFGEPLPELVRQSP